MSIHPDPGPDLGEILTIATRYSRKHLPSDIGPVSADDVAQEMCLAIWAARTPNYGVRAGIMRHKIADAWRVSYRSRSDPYETLPEQATGNQPEDAALHADLRARLDAAIATLSARHQQVIQLRFWGQLTVRETAHRLHLGEVHVRVLQNRALHALRAALTTTTDLEAA